MSGEALPEPASGGAGPEPSLRDPDDVPIEELSVEPPPVAPGPPNAPPVSTRPTSAAGRPLPLLVREPSSRDGAPAAPRVTSAPWGRIGSGSPTSPPPSSAAPDSTYPTALRGRPQAAASHLSPRMIAVFGGLFGLATVSSVVALLIQVAPPRDERAVMAGTPPQDPESTTAEGAEPAAAPVVKKKERVAVPGPWRLSELAKDPSISIVSGTTERKSFITALEDKGVPRSQSYRIMKAFEGLRKFDKTGKKDVFTVAMEKATHKVRAFEYAISPSEVYQAREGDGGLLAGARLDMKIAEEETVAAFYVGKDLTASYKAAGLEDGILETIDDAFNGRLSTESFQEGGVVRIIAVEETALGLFSRYKDIVAIEYRPPDPAEKPTRIYRFKGEQASGYFDERGRQPYSGGWRSPVPGAPITSPYNPKRMHPILHKIMPHQGTDFGAPMGTPVYSAYRGVVASAGPGGPAGNLVMINHPGGISTGYAHLSRFGPIKAGDKVGTHQLIGYVGTTGRSTGPHLHFIAKRDGQFFNAETLQLDGERVMPGVDRPAFLTAKAALDARLDAIALPEPPAEKPVPAPAASGSAAAPAEAAPAPSGGGEPGDAPAAPAATGAATHEGTDDEGEDIVGPALGGGAVPGSSAAPPP